MVHTIPLFILFRYEKNVFHNPFFVLPALGFLV
jgi:hypothetical protein